MEVIVVTTSRAERTSLFESLKRKSGITLAAVGLVALAGCSSSPDAQPSTQTTIGASETPSPEASTPSAETNATTQAEALAAVDKMDADYKAVHAIYQQANTNAGGDQGKLAAYYYGTTEITRKLVQDEAFRTEFGICKKELEVAKWTNDEYIRITDPYLEKTLSAPMFTNDDRQLYGMDRNRAINANTVISYLETVIPDDASCVSPNIKLDGEDRDYLVNVNGEQISVKNLSPISVVLVDPYPGIVNSTIAEEAILVRQFPDGRKACDAVDYWATENDGKGVPPSVQNPDFVTTYNDASMPTGDKTQIEIELVKRWNAYRLILKENALKMYVKLC